MNTLGNSQIYGSRPPDCNRASLAPLGRDFDRFHRTGSTIENRGISLFFYILSFCRETITLGSMEFTRKTIRRSEDRRIVFCLTPPLRFFNLSYCLCFTVYMMGTLAYTSKLASKTAPKNLKGGVDFFNYKNYNI